ncbi:MAG TPA: hypothetical protein VH643_39075 [Gemmataceae bacterium]
MKHLSDIQTSFLKRLMGKVLDFVPVPAPVGGAGEIRQWCHDICAVETLREVAERWARCVKELGEYLLTVGLADTLRQRVPATPRGLLVVDLKTCEEFAGAILCVAVDEAEGNDIFRRGRVAVQSGKEFPETERERAARQVADAWQITDVLGNMLVVDEDTLRRFMEAVRDIVESILPSDSVNAPPDLSALGSEVAALLQRAVETEGKLLENWRAQLAPVLSPRRSQRLNDEAETIAVHLAQLFAVSSITPRELYGYLRSRHHWTPDAFTGLTDRQIFDAIERDVRLVLDSYAALLVPPHLLNVTYHELSELSELYRLDITTEDGIRHVRHNWSRWGPILNRLMTTVVAAWHRTPLGDLLQRRFGNDRRAGLRAAGDWLRGCGLSPEQVDELTVAELIQRLETWDSRRRDSVEMAVAPGGSVTINPAAALPSLAGLPVTIVPAWEEHRDQVIQSIIAAATSSRAVASSTQAAPAPDHIRDADGARPVLEDLRATAAKEFAGTASRKPKRSTERGEAREKIIAGLTEHHQYTDGSCLNTEPIGVGALARKAGVSKSSVSEFFQSEFKGHDQYRVVCQDISKLVASLKMLRGEYSPHILYGRIPPGEGDHDDE